MFRIIIGVLCSVFYFGAVADQNFTEGQHYERITPEVATHADGKIEVVEVFWYGCHHCFSFEPHIEKWQRSLPDNVVFRRMPGVFARTWVPHARAFYTAEILGVLDKIHTPLFEAIHEQHRKIGDEDSLARFFAEHGVADEDFREAYNSFSVDTKTRQALTASKDYGITGVPSVIVNGRFRSSARLTGSYEDLLKVLDTLVDKETKQ
ncbi:MAG: thiol:disulfide interchange protein DsbA/DsbL [Gammaproteobacteria bacterium]|jgi:thiol:disulfide interchange protein DsbA|nr:thiol:disulfide interchange protein DsbA/DsbL [Gammaproteobacteria bacterium]